MLREVLNGADKSHSFASSTKDCQKANIFKQMFIKCHYYMQYTVQRVWQTRSEKKYVYVIGKEKVFLSYFVVKCCLGWLISEAILNFSFFCTQVAAVPSIFKLLLMVRRRKLARNNKEECERKMALILPAFFALILPTSNMQAPAWIDALNVGSWS